MSSYTVRAGDTFESISRSQYGSGEYALVISQANPGAVEPLNTGTILLIPPLPFRPSDVPAQAPSAGVDEVAVLVDGVRFKFWSAIRLSRMLDSMDTLQFSAPFDSGNEAFRQSFQPFTYKPVAVTVGGDPLFTGTMIGIEPNVSGREKTFSVSGYSNPGVLGDCTPPASAYPVEFNNVTLQEIAVALCQPFGISPVFESAPGPAFQRVSMEPNRIILGFLSELARQRSLVLSSTPAGRLLFRQSVAPGIPVAILRQGDSPVLEVRVAFSSQQYYSAVTGLESVYLGTRGSQYTVLNDHLRDPLRPFTFNPPDTLGGEIESAVRAKIGRMFGAMAAYTVRVDTWRDAGGQLWAPNTTITLQAPDAMVYEDYEFIVRGVAFGRSADGATAELDLVMPGAYSGEIPAGLPWD